MKGTDDVEEENIFEEEETAEFLVGGYVRITRQKDMGVTGRIKRVTDCYVVFETKDGIQLKKSKNNVELVMWPQHVARKRT